MITLEDLRGSINDVDSHELIPVPLWDETFGEAGSLVADFVRSSKMPLLDPEDAAQRAAEGKGSNSPNVDVPTDATPVTLENIIKIKGATAPGAIDPHRRVEVLDALGVDRQMIFAGFALFGQALGHQTPEDIEAMFGVDMSAERAPEICILANKAHNNWAIEFGGTNDRLRPVANLWSYDFDDMMAETQRVIDGGVRVVWIPASLPPCGVSPADRLLDPFWELCESSNTAVVTHIIGESFLASRVWRQVPELLPDGGSFEFPLDPWTLSTTHFAPQSFLTTLILGGVFERHPGLRVGVLECGAHWVGSFAEQLAMWGKVFRRRYATSLSLPVEEYFKRNIRVSAFWFEEVDKYIERYGLEDVYCYASDYPHVEGGVDPMSGFWERLKGMGDTTLQKFFVDNGRLLLPA